MGQRAAHSLAVATLTVDDCPETGDRREDMQLHYNVASPFVRKVMAVAIETGLAERIEPVKRLPSPIAPVAEVNADNPLGKIPCLVTDEAGALYDSRVICEYLDSLHQGPKMFPASGAPRWTALRRQALADGIMDAGVLTRYETFVRPQEARWEAWTENQKQKFRRGLNALESEGPSLGVVDIGTLAIACALGYLDFRYPEEDWRAGRPRLTAWLEQFGQRPSIAQTAPQEVW
jgi:glutathione S-transferase